MLESIEKSPTRYKITIRHLVFKGVSFQSAWHFMKHCKGMSSWAFSHGWTPPTHTCKGTSRGRLHLKLPHESQKTSISSAKCLSAEHSFSFLFTSWHGKTKSVPMNSRLQWGMDLTRGKYLPLSNAQWVSTPVCINITVPGKREYQRSLRKPHFSQDGWAKATVLPSEGGKGQCPRETAGMGRDPGPQPPSGGPQCGCCRDAQS